MLFRLGSAGGLVLLAAVVASGCSTSTEGLPNPGDAAVEDAPQSGGGGGRTDTRIADASSFRSDGAAQCPDAPASRRALGQSCACGSDCGSGFCVDGVCCSSACDGTCMACNIQTSLGTCAAIPAGQRPVVRGQCREEPASGCGLDGTCDGRGACRRWPDGTLCATGRCMGSSVVGAMVCMAGACRAGPTVACTPFACDTANGRCFTSCTSNSQCDGKSCQGGSCGKKALGATCAAGAECDSGSCADGVCCNLACTGACVSCNQPGKMGECAPVPAGNRDPHAVCRTDAPTSCGQSGLCNGQGGCARYAAGTVCKPAACSGGSLVPASTCNGNGTCVVGSPIDCFPYVCSGNACKASCASSADCATGNTCMNGSCGRKGLGQSCTSGAQCRSGFCVDGVCCDQACGGRCSYCGFPNALGRCVFVGAGVPDPRAAAGVTDPMRVCLDQGPASCGTNGRCNGSGGCQTYPAGTVCRAESCDAATNRHTGEGVCRSGACTSPAALACAPYRCNGTRCASSCGTNDQCVSPNICRDGSCGKKPIGSLCAKADECASGFCAQGVCCSTACTASCFSCDVAGSVGTCTAVPAGGADPAAQCKDDGASSCGNDGSCNGTGGCRKYAAGTVCAAAACASGTFTAASTCDGAGKCVVGSRRSCSPYLCNTAGTDCYSSCTDAAQCASGRPCAMGMCGRKNNGASCTDRGECQSNNCIDGVCCDSDCTGVCRSCSLTGSLGVCTNIPDGGNDPNNGCPPAAEATCGNDGFCNGQGACRKWGTSTACRAASCPTGSSTLTKAASCDGKGSCPTSDTQSCGSYKCDPATSMCKTSCASGDDCATGFMCASMSCGKKPPGSSCAMGADCESGNCVDNTCCSSSSCGTCKTCANAQGTCQNVANDMSDPDSCTDQTSSNKCGTIGKCDGNGQCKFAGQGTACGSTCTGDGSGVTTKTCNGSGACSGTGSTTSCNGYVCTNGACASTCDPMNPSLGCILPKVCLGTQCVDPTPDAGAPDGGP